MRLLIALFILGGTLLVADVARAENWYKRLTPKQLNDEMYSLAIKVEPVKTATDVEYKDHAGEFIQFQVTVMPKIPGKDIPKDLFHSGELRLFDGEAFISSCNVQMTQSHGVWLCSFKIAKKYVGKSGFIFSATDTEGQGAHYWLYLNDFIPSSK
jgi:hypothetical protein